MAAYELIGDFIAEVDSRLLELKGDVSDKERAVKSALVTYSKDKSDERTSDITGDGRFDYTINSANFPSYVTGFSQITQVEYPYDATQAEPNYLDGDHWKREIEGTTLVLRLLYATPSSSETVRPHYTIPYVFAGAPDQVTMPDTDFYAVCDLGTSYALDGIAARLTATGRSTIEADAVNYRTKSGEARSLSQMFAKRYTDHMGIKEGGKAPATAVVTDIDVEFSFQSDYLTHPSRWR